MTEVALIVGALLIDRVIGEPPNALHPVVWMGHMIRALSDNRLIAGRSVALQILWGACIALLVPGTFACVGYVLLESLLPWPLSSFVVSVVLLKCALSLDGLRQAAERMHAGLTTNLDAGRDALRHLCSRDPSALEEPQLIAATVESLAENTSDSVIAPLFYFALFGVPGALAYRAVNTMDAMIGYHGRWEYIGKAAARVDDLLNLIPARMTALLLLVAGRWHGHDATRGWRIMRRDARNTESPNAGWPMAAMAGLLNTQLTKVDHYRLGDAVTPLTRDSLRDSWAIVRAASWLGAALYMAGLGASHVIR